jgi:mono/diheme cytochrome c family protein
MNIRKSVILSALVLVACAAMAQIQHAPKVPPNVEAGKQTYMEHCATCHGNDGRGNGPVASVLRMPPPDLRTLALRHGGKFPEDYVTNVLRFGIQIPAHGTSDMPVWGPIFGVLENGNELAVRRRIKYLCDFLATIQDAES